MNMEFILREVDRLFEENRAKDAEAYLLDCLRQSRDEGALGVSLQILNELIGYYRQTSEREELTKVIQESLALAEELDLKDTIWYGTTALNVANGYRSLGELELSGRYYDEAEAIYSRDLSANDMLVAGLFNNRSLLFQEEKNFEKAEEYLLKALSISLENHAGFEIAVTYANLANTAVARGDDAKAEEYAGQAMECFEKINLYDAHYCAALSALGLCRQKAGREEEAVRLFEKGMRVIERSLGRNVQYERLQENRDACLDVMERTGKLPQGVTREAYLQGVRRELERQEREKLEKEAGEIPKEQLDRKERQQADLLAGKRDEKHVSGLELCRAYYETYGKPMLEEKFPKYVSRIAVGLVGEGSDCMGFDDEASHDHDWGPGFCLFIPERLESEIGAQLQEAYDALPEEFMGYRRVQTRQGKQRLGVMTTEEFYRKYAGLSEAGEPDWKNVEDVSLLAATDGEVFADPEGTFTRIREKLKAGYPEEIRYLKLAEDAAKISQTGQYNYFRMLERGDRMTADWALADCMGHVMRFWHHFHNVYPPHDKWLKKSCQGLAGGKELVVMLEQIHGSFQMEKDEAFQTVNALLEIICGNLARLSYDANIISDVDSYLDHHVEELLMKAAYAKHSDVELVDAIAKIEFQAFDKVQNEGGRAYCQNDWPTFSVMRKSQYLTWDRPMLMQYLYDFNRELALGHNLITEKYGRMMESTAPERYARLEKHFPEIPAEKKAVIEQVVALQMSMVEELAKEYPKVVANARNLHTYEDNVVDTSYETYLRGEISTYSDKMLQLYAGYVIRCAREGVNIAKVTMENTARLYGYQNLDAFQESM